MTPLQFFAWWGVLSVPAALFVGAMIRFGMGDPEAEAERARQVVEDVFDGRPQ